MTATEEAAVQHERMTVPKPGPDQVAFAVCAEDGARAWAAFSREFLAEDGALAAVLALLEEAQAEARARKEPGESA